MVKYLKDFTYKDISDYCNYEWQCSCNGAVVIAIKEFLDNAPKIRRFYKVKDTIKREEWWQEHKSELLNKDRLNKKVDTETWEFVE